VVIVGAAGAVYFVARDGSPGGDALPAMVSGSATDAGTARSDAAPPRQVAEADQPPIGPDEHILGASDAPVTIIEYASMTCPHCASFHVETLPRIKSEFIDKGLVRMVFRPFPLDGLAARATLLAQCVPGAGYFSMIDILFRSQGEWSRAADPVAELMQIGRTAGLSDADIDRCITDEAEADRIIASMQKAQEDFGINSTPSFVINGTTYSNMPFDDYQDGGTTKPGFGKVIRDLLPET
jgi:protein-disulfide isomerase